MIDKELIELACQSRIDPTQWLEGTEGLGSDGISARLLDETISPAERKTLTRLILEACPKTALGREGTDVLPVEPPQRTPMQDTSLEQEQTAPGQDNEDHSAEHLGGRPTTAGASTTKQEDEGASTTKQQD